ncbi:MAG: alpha/beta hydrolase [Clostridium sp.]|nr:alpha/beta hydrolase [Clostridium sp.]
MEKMICRQGMADTSQAWIYYKESGRGTPILMLHGNAETHLIFDYYEEKLSMKYRVVLMDSRAHGRSRIKPEYAESEFTTTDMARDAAALLDILHIPSCILFGFSDGANIALEFASLFPERTQAVIAISGNVSPDGLIFPVRAFCVGKYYCLRAAAEFFKHRNGNDFVRKHIFPPLFHHQQLTSLLCNSPMISHKQLEKIQAPVLLIAGTRDLVKVSHSRLMARLIPHAQLVLVKGATHTAMFGRKAFYLKIISDFLNKFS